jgi:hypothetical protein
MAQQPLTTTISEFTSWFNDTRYAIREMQDDMMSDPIFSLLGEDTSDNRSSQLSTTGIDYSGIAPVKTPGGVVARSAPVQADQHTVQYLTFVKRFDYEREAIIHDQYRILDPNGTECLKQLWAGVGLFLTNCVWNQNQNSNFNVPAQQGVINYTITTPDGQPIVSASHTGPGYTASTNIGGTGAFSGSTVVTNLQVGYQNAKTPAGVPMTYNGDALACGRVGPLIESMTQYTKSERVFSSLNNAVTVFQNGTMDVIEFKYAPRNSDLFASYATGNSALYQWATLDRDLFKKSFKYKWAEMPTIVEGPTVDMNTLDTFRIATCRIAFLPENPWALIQNNASTAPITAY